MKKLLGLLLALIIVSLCLVGCEYFAPKHEHEFSPSYDETCHFQKCPCGEIKDKADHNLEWVVTNEATCTSDGCKVLNCICGLVIEEQIIPAEGHIFNNYECTVCTTPISLEDGFIISGELIPTRFAAYRNNTCEFDIDHVTLEFFYGGLWANDIEFVLTHSDNYPEFDLYFVNSDGDELLVKHVEENFVSEKYRCDVYYVSPRKTGVIFNFSEYLTIPKELFCKNSGVIYFEIRGVNPRSPSQKVDLIASEIIYYRIINDTVFLSNKRFY